MTEWKTGQSGIYSGQKHKKVLVPLSVKKNISSAQEMPEPRAEEMYLL